MDIQSITTHLEKLISEFGDRPFGFFTILSQSDEPNLDIEAQNEQWAFVKSETWHSLDLSNYILWSLSDNGDLLWWNGNQSIAMDHRSSIFVSVPVSPQQFIRLAGMNKIGKIFPLLV